MRLKIGIQGGQASYHEAVAMQLHPDDKIVYYETFADLFGALTNRSIDRAVCAVSNNRTGPIPEPQAELKGLGGNYIILNEIPLAVHHSLLVVPGTRLRDIRSVRSQLPALEQCREFLRNTLPKAKQLAEEDTALAAKVVAESGDATSAAIASAAAGKLYGLEPLLTSIQDDPSNITNFLEIKLK